MREKSGFLARFCKASLGITQCFSHSLLQEKMFEHFNMVSRMGTLKLEFVYMLGNFAYCFNSSDFVFKLTFKTLFQKTIRISKDCDQ